MDITITILIAISGSAGSVFMLGWWLSGRFRKSETAQRDRMDAIATAQREQLDKHEDRDQARHAENIGRFENMAERGNRRHEENQQSIAKINVSLAKLGSNGNHG